MYAYILQLMIMLLYSMTIYFSIVKYYYILLEGSRKLPQDVPLCYADCFELEQAQGELRPSLNYLEELGLIRDYQR